MLTSRKTSWVVVLACFTLPMMSACGPDSPAAPELLTDSGSNDGAAGAALSLHSNDCPEEVITDEYCRDPGDGFLSWRFFGLTDRALRNAPNDPTPGADGIWLGANTSPETCFAATGRTIIDADKDWLDDGCEYRIAYAFAPSLLMLQSSTCAQGEPYWAAKYFAKAGIVRIAYMPAYYRDCGHPNVSPPLPFLGPHAGDSEFIWVEVFYNVVTRHWNFHSMWLSAHFGQSVLGESVDRSAQVSAGATSFYSVYRSHPEIWVATSKHANYNSMESCRQPTPIIAAFHDICGPPSYNWPIRFPVTISNNVGSRFVGTSCVPSRDIYAGNGVYECFYNYNVGFRGWQKNSTGVTGYYEHLMSPRFESRRGDWGPGPNPPTLTAEIGGPKDPVEFTRTTWTATASQGRPPYTYRWTVNDRYASNSSTLTRWSGARGTFLYIYLEITDSEGARATSTARVVAVGSDGGFIW